MNTNLSVDPSDAILDPTGNPMFQNKSWDGWPIKCGLLKYQSDFQEAYIETNYLAVAWYDFETTSNVIKNHMDQRDWGSLPPPPPPPHFLSKFLNNSFFTAYVSTMTNDRLKGNLHKILFTNSRRRQLT